MITLPEKLSTMVPYDPIQDEYQIRLDANESFYDMPEELREAIADAIHFTQFNRYPDPSAKLPRKMAGRVFGIHPDCMVCGAGLDEILSLMTNTFVPRGGKVMVLAPDFSMYQFYAEVCELEVVKVQKDENFSIRADELIEQAKQHKPNMLVFSNPCNPGGQGFCREDVVRICTALQDVLVVVDEAYMDFWDQSILDICTGFDNVLVLKTLSKAYGCAAIRMGFAIGNTELVGQLNKTRSPYNINTLTQTIACLVLQDAERIRQRTAQIVANKEQLERDLQVLAERYDGI
ncbi:MAG: pyridoxal phosphate-dependent aminotransferase, partial [Butyricicoccaceae bacterium]